MTTHCPHKLILSRVPDLQLTRVGANSEMGTITGPLYTGDAVVRPYIAQLCHLAVHS